jgi:hypothetical protein
MSVQQKGGRYYPVLSLGRDPATGKPRYRWYDGYATRREAEKAERQLRAAQDRGGQIEAGAESTGRFLQRWVDEYAKSRVAPLTYQRYSEIVQTRLVPALGHIPLRKLRARAHRRGREPVARARGGRAEA